MNALVVNTCRRGPIRSTSHCCTEGRVPTDTYFHLHLNKNWHFKWLLHSTVPNSKKKNELKRSAACARSALPVKAENEVVWSDSNSSHGTLSLLLIRVACLLRPYLEVWAFQVLRVAALYTWIPFTRAAESERKLPEAALFDEERVFKV
jgi:hypothetical protein